LLISVAKIVAPVFTIAGTLAVTALLTYAALDWLSEGRRRYEQTKRGKEAATPFILPEPQPGISTTAKKMSRRLAPLALRHNVGRQLTLAGNPKDVTVEDILLLKWSLGIVSILIVTFMVLMGKAGGSTLLLMTLLVVPAGFFLPDLWLSRRGDERQKLIRRDLAGSLDILTISVEAGLAFDGAMAKVVENSTGPLADEFLRTSREMQFGVSRREAFHNLASRTNVDELSSFVLAITQADTFGVSIGNVLRSQAKEMRVKQRQAAEERAMQTPVKIVFPLLLCIFPAIIMVVLGPAIIKMIQAFGAMGG